MAGRADSKPPKQCNLEQMFLRFIHWYQNLKFALATIPFFILYFIICISFKPAGFIGDEERYLTFASNLWNGYYSPATPYFTIWNGPGYPILIAPFVLLNLPVISFRILNSLLLYLSLIVTNKTLNYFIPKNAAMGFTILLGLYYPIYQMLPLILTECASWFVISLLCYIITLNFRKPINLKLNILAGLTIAYLAMTKVIFGHVIITMFLFSLFLLIFSTARNFAIKSIIICSFSLLFCLPWLLYTYNLSGEPLYWSNSGGMSLYTMSTPFPDENGDWHNFDDLRSNPNHREFISRIEKLPSLEMDKEFQAAAISNIKAHPVKYFKNWIANVGRLIFSYPFSHAEQSIETYFTIIPNMFVIVLIVISLLICVKNPKLLPHELYFMLLFVLIYLFASSLVSAYRRMFFITMPFWSIFIAYVLHSSIKIKTVQD